MVGGEGEEYEVEEDAKGRLMVDDIARDRLP